MVAKYLLDTNLTNAVGSLSSSTQNSWKAIRPTRATESKLVNANAEIAKVIKVYEILSAIPTFPRKVAMADANICAGVPAGRPSAVAAKPTQTNAITAKKLSKSIAPKETGSIAFSLLICFDDVPDDTREWKPDTAPHAMVTNKVGNKYETVLVFAFTILNAVNTGRFIAGW